MPVEVALPVAALVLDVIVPREDLSADPVPPAVAAALPVVVLFARVADVPLRSAEAV
jgi:hypothetical protein